MGLELRLGFNKKRRLGRVQVRLRVGIRVRLRVRVPAITKSGWPVASKSWQAFPPGANIFARIERRFAACAFSSSSSAAVKILSWEPRVRVRVRVRF